VFRTEAFGLAASHAKLGIFYETSHTCRACLPALSFFLKWLFYSVWRKVIARPSFANFLLLKRDRSLGAFPVKAVSTLRHEALPGPIYTNLYTKYPKHLITNLDAPKTFTTKTKY